MSNNEKTEITPELLYRDLRVPSPVSPLYSVEEFRRDCETGNLPEDIIHEILLAVYHNFWDGFYKNWDQTLAQIEANDPEMYKDMAGWSDERVKEEAERLALAVSSEFGFIEDGKPSEKCLALARIILADQHPE